MEGEHLCVICGKPTQKIKRSNVYRQTCSYECMVKQRSMISSANAKKNPATRIRIAKKPSPKKRREFLDQVYNDFKRHDQVVESRIIESIVGG